MAINKKNSQNGVNAERRNYVITQMGRGIDPVTSYSLNPDLAVEPSKLVQYCTTHPEFKIKMSQAYSVLYMYRQAELNRLSTMSATEFSPHLEFKEGEALLKRRVDALKFDLGRIAPILSKMYESKSYTVQGPKTPLLKPNPIEDKPQVLEFYTPSSTVDLPSEQE